MFNESGSNYRGGGGPAILPGASEILAFRNLQTSYPFGRLEPIPDQNVRKPLEALVNAEEQVPQALVPEDSLAK